MPAADYKMTGISRNTVNDGIVKSYMKNCSWNMKTVNGKGMVTGKDEKGILFRTIVKRQEKPRLITSSELPTAMPPACIEGTSGMAMDNSREVMGGRWAYVY